jgi:hypothetical protein
LVTKTRTLAKQQLSEISLDFSVETLGFQGQCNNVEIAAPYSHYDQLAKYKEPNKKSIMDSKDATQIQTIELDPLIYNEEIKEEDIIDLEYFSRFTFGINWFKL